MANDKFKKKKWSDESYEKTTILSVESPIVNGVLNFFIARNVEYETYYFGFTNTFDTQKSGAFTKFSPYVKIPNGKDGVPGFLQAIKWGIERFFSDVPLEEKPLPDSKEEEVPEDDNNTLLYDDPF